MAGTVTVKSEADLLQEIYRNVKMAEESLIGMMPKIKEEQLKSDMTVQVSVYEAFASRAVKLLGEAGAKPEEENLWTRMGAKWGIWMNTMKDSTPEHLAQMLIEGTTMGVGDMLRYIRESENSGIREEAIRLAKDVCEYEEKTVEDLKRYLRTEKEDENNG